MEEFLYTIRENRPLAPGVFRLSLSGGGAAPVPGQFVQLRLPGRFLRRPFSVCDAEEDRLTVIYKAVGRGTEELSRLEPGAELPVLAPLGTGFDLDRAGETPLLVAGGLGLTPLYFLAKTLRRQGREPRVFLGFNTEKEVFYDEAFRALGCEVTVCTVDGSTGRQGLVTEALPPDGSFFCACGPEPMLRTLCRKLPGPGQLSLEARMGCGFGACMGCTVQTASGPRRVCKEGPVFDKEELLWPTQE